MIDTKPKPEEEKGPDEKKDEEEKQPEPLTQTLSNPSRVMRG